MDRHQRRTLVTLAGILAVLVVLVLVVATVKHRRAAQEEAAAAQSEEGVLTQKSAYTALAYSNGSATLSFALDAEDGAWHWADDPEFPLDDATVTAITELLGTLKPQQTITDGDTLEAYGLEEPFATLLATAQDEETLTLALGNATTDGTSYYMLLNGDESTVYIIADTLYQKMSVPIYDMMELPEVPALTADNLTSLTVEGGVQTSLQAIRAEDGTVSWRSGGANVTDSETVSALVTELGALTLSKCVDYKPSDQAAALCGFDAPAAVVTASYTGEGGGDAAMTLVVGAKALGGEGYYVRLNSDPTIYELPADSLTTVLALAAAGLES